MASFVIHEDQENNVNQKEKRVPLQKRSVLGVLNVNHAAKPSLGEKELQIRQEQAVNHQKLEHVRQKQNASKVEKASFTIYEEPEVGRHRKAEAAGKENDLPQDVISLHKPRCQVLLSQSPHVQSPMVLDRSRGVSPMVVEVEARPRSFQMHLLEVLEYKDDVYAFMKQAEKTSDALSKLSKQSQSHLTSQLKLVGERSLKKLNDLIDSDSGREFIEWLGRLFDPRNILKLSLKNHEICDAMKKVPILCELSSESLQPYLLFRDSVVTVFQNDQDVDIVKLLLSLKCDFSDFVNVAVKSVWIPVSNVGTERSFSMYGNIMTDRKINLKPSNMELMTVLAFSD